ncbi:MAG: NfeD family protein [Candidatus Aminicenantes bacterium]|nr:NfeD family protein [Candidatus Aminicenantes bacterium]
MDLKSLLSVPPEIIWAILGVVLIFVEFFIPGLVIAFFGVGALVTGLTTWIGLSSSLTMQMLVFITSSILLLVFLRKYVKRVFLGKSQTKDRYTNFNIELGKIVPVLEFIQPGEVGGKVRYQGSNWSARADDPIAPGESVKIIGRDNITLIVKKVEKI